MKRVGFLLKVREDKIPEYKAHHQNVPPDMLDALRRRGWRNYSLFMRPDGLLFGYFEADESFAASLAGMSGERRQPPLAGTHVPVLRDPARREPRRNDA